MVYSSDEFEENLNENAFVSIVINKSLTEKMFCLNQESYTDNEN